MNSDFLHNFFYFSIPEKDPHAYKAVISQSYNHLIILLSLNHPLRIIDKIISLYILHNHIFLCLFFAWY